jgi:hypothetical protein
LKAEKPAQGRRGTPNGDELRDQDPRQAPLCGRVPQEEPDHKASLAIWDVPSRAVMSRRFKLKVGAKCSAGCQLAGREIEVCDDTGVTVASAQLGETPWLGTTGLFWAEVDLTAPIAEGQWSWSAKFPAAESHCEATSTFSFLTVKPPEHTVTIKVIDRDTQAPVSDVAVRLGVYRAFTDENGLARMETAKGTYDLTIHKVDYETCPKIVDVSGDVSVQVEVWFAPKPTAEPYWG